MEFRIDLQNLEFYAIIGILPKEREMEQKLIVDLWLTYLYEKGFIDYAKIAQMIKEHIKSSRFELLEEALTSTAHLLKKRFPQIQTLFIRLTKPQILPDATPSVSLLLKFD